MNTLRGEAPPPTFRSIFAGIAAAILLLFAFLNLPTLFKSAGAVLGFIPSKIGLIQVVRPADVLPIDLSVSPSAIVLAKPGNYLLYTDNYDLLVINDAIVEADSKSWLRIESQNNEEIPVTLISRGMAIYDSIHARGRPVAMFTIDAPGTYSMIHPTRYATASVVPNYTSGNENWITFLYVAQVALLIYIIWDIRAAIRARKQKASA
jgi:hypothetical protein